MPAESASTPPTQFQDPARHRSLQLLGILCGFTAGAWLGAAEAPTKLVSIGVSPIVISLIMVIGVFLARWSLPALVLGIFWGFLFFNELRQAGWRRWAGVLGGALIMCVGATVLAIASASQGSSAHSLNGVWAALGAGVLWGTMYIPYRKAYLTGMNPLSFVTFFTFGEVGMMTVLALGYIGLSPLWHVLVQARGVIFWLMLGGFIWVIGDLFQQYAAKYVGISRGIPLSNTNQLWGLLWGILVFGELQGKSHTTYLEVIGGSLLMMLGVGAIALSSATGKEQQHWKEAAQREGERYGVAADYVAARFEGRQAAGETPPSRSVLDWLLVAAASAVLLAFATMARVPQFSFRWGPALALIAALLLLLFLCGRKLWRTTRFH